MIKLHTIKIHPCSVKGKEEENESKRKNGKTHQMPSICLSLTRSLSIWYGREFKYIHRWRDVERERERSSSSSLFFFTLFLHSSSSSFFFFFFVGVKCVEGTGWDGRNVRLGLYIRPSRLDYRRKVRSSVNH